MAVSENDVFEAANALLHDLDVIPSKITIALVRERLGGTGSQPTIAKHLRAWKATQKTESPLPASISAAGTDFMNQIWSSAKAEAEKEYHEERRQMTSQAEEMQALLEQSEGTQKDLEVSLGAAHAATDRVQNEVDIMIGEANRLTADLADAMKSKEVLVVDNLMLEKQVAVLEAQLIAKDELHAQALASEKEKTELLKAAIASKEDNESS